MSTTQHADTPEPSHPSATGGRVAAWGTRLGALAFAFFLIKGLAWLVVPAALAVIASR